MPSSVAIRTSTSLRCRSVKELQHLRGLVEVEVHQDRGDDLRLLVAHQLGHRAGSIHFRLSMPAMSPPCRIRSSSMLALSSPSALRSTVRTYSSVSATRLTLLAGDAGEQLEHVLDPLARDRLHLRDRFAQALHLFRRQVLEHLGGFFLAERHQQDRGVLEAGLVHGRSALSQRSAGAAASPSTQSRRMPAHGGRVLLAPACARSSRCSAVRGAGRAGRPRAATTASSATPLSGPPARAGGSGASAASSAGRPCRRTPAGRPSPARPVSRRRAACRACRACFHHGTSTGVTVSTLNGALITFTESPRSCLKPMLSRTSAVSFSISSAGQRRPAWSCPWRRSTLRWLTTTAAFRRLTVPLALRVTRTVLSTS